MVIFQVYRHNTSHLLYKQTEIILYCFQISLILTSVEWPTRCCVNVWCVMPYLHSLWCITSFNMFCNHFIFVNAAVIENSCMFFFTVVLSRQLDCFCVTLEVSSAKRVSYHVVLGLKYHHFTRDKINCWLRQPKNHVWHVGFTELEWNCCVILNNI